MHMDAMSVIGANTPQNIIHIVINNGAHETVGGMPTVAGKIDFVLGRPTTTARENKRKYMDYLNG